MHSLLSHFMAVDDFLFQHRHFWQYRPFELLSLPWQKQHASLCQWLAQRSIKEIDELKRSPEAAAVQLAQFIPALSAYTTLCDVPLSQPRLTPSAPHWQQGIPGRKIQQIEQFIGAIETPISAQANWLEWCAGKGYLGRMLAVKHQAKVISLEWQETLCQQGQAFAERHQLNMKFVQQDAFAPQSLSLIHQVSHAAALHACGSLHVRLLQAATQSNIESLMVSPCCYHLIAEQHYQPLSQTAKQSALRLTRQCLKLPLQETVTAGKKVQALREIEVSYRLGFDSLQKALHQRQAYLPLPNIQKSLLSGSFADFCHWGAQQKGIVLPEGIDFTYYQQQGKARFLLVEQMDVVLSVFRRPLELWLALDRALFMQEHGFKVQLTQFCERALTPRNLLIYAKK